MTYSFVQWQLSFLDLSKITLIPIGLSVKSICQNWSAQRESKTFCTGKYNTKLFKMHRIIFRVFSAYLLSIRYIQHTSSKHCRYYQPESRPNRLLGVASFFVAVAGVHGVVFGTSGRVPGFHWTGVVVTISWNNFFCKNKFNPDFS